MSHTSGSSTVEHGNPAGNGDDAGNANNAGTRTAATATYSGNIAEGSSAAAISGVHAYVAKRPGVAIEAVDLVKDYGEDENVVHALRGVNVNFEQGKFTTIMGPSGSGKSTLMHTLAGLDTPTSGNIVFSGSDITSMNDKQLTLMRRNNVGFIFQSFNLLPMFTAEQNIVMPLTLAGTKPDKRWMQTLVETLGLEGRLGHRPHELSGGQQQRVAIARALISKPSIVFADEPTGNLDSVSSAEVLEFLKRSVREFAQTIIMVTHDAVAASYADRAIVFADGRIVADVQHPTADTMNALLLEERRKTTAPATFGAGRGRVAENNTVNSTVNDAMRDTDHTTVNASANTAVTSVPGR